MNDRLFRTILKRYCEGLGFGKEQNRVRGPSGAFGKFSKKGSIVSKLCSNKCLPHFSHKNAKARGCFAKAKYANSKAPEGRVRGVFTKHSNTNRSF